MSKDIRSFFSKSPKNATTTKKRPVVLVSSDEEDTKATSPKKQQNASKTSNRRHGSSDSKDKTQIKKKEEKIGKEKKEEKLKPTTFSDFFGKKGITRVNAPVISKKLEKKEAEFHDDHEFKDTLSELDIAELEDKMWESGPASPKINVKRKNSDEPAVEVKTKKIRLDESSGEKKEEQKSSKGKTERKASSEDEKEAELQKTDKTDGKSSVKRETSADGKAEATDHPNSTQAVSSSNKLKFNKLKKNKKADIVMEPKDEGKKKKKKEHEAEVAEHYAEVIEKKKERAALYNRYLQRGGARNPGSKPIPTGADNCLAGFTFLLTGVLESLERSEAEDLIKQYGGRVVTTISKNTSYLIVGEDAGPSKLAKAATFGTKQISEDELLDLIRTRPAGNARDIIQPRNHSTNRKKSKSPEKDKIPSPKEVSPPAKPAPEVEERPSTSFQKPETEATSSPSTSGNTSQTSNNSKDQTVAQTLVDKYRPKNMKQIIGQHGEKSNANKLYAWLKNWDKNRASSAKPIKQNKWAPNADGSIFKACLLSGPPGVGKTTTAQIVCAELKYDVLEFNASDTRSKRSLQEEVSAILSNNTVKGYFTENSDHKVTKKHVLVMDEVDGMAGNEDRGGLQELITLIKMSEVPIICICNDRNHMKMRTLSNHTYDLRFEKPRVEQIKGAMRSLCFKEKIDISAEDLERLIQSTNQDIRQIINHLAMLSSGPTNQDAPKGPRMNKDFKLGPWDVIQKVFSAEEHAKMSLFDRRNLFFNDYNIAGLFVQENYLSVQPKAPKNELLSRVARAANSLAVADVIENAIRGNGKWSLLPTQAYFSSVIPGSLMSGKMMGRAAFPSWLGRNSKRGKFNRILQQITVHTRLATGASKEAMNIDYLNHLRDAVLRPLVLEKTEGINAALEVMNHYHLLREDLDSMTEVSLWPSQHDPLQAIEGYVKAAFTRAYNKSSAPTPYIPDTGAPKRSTAQATHYEDMLEDEDEENAGSDGDNDNVDSDKLIKAKKATGDKTAKNSKVNAKPKAKRGRGKAK